MNLINNKNNNKNNNINEMINFKDDFLYIFEIKTIIKNNY